MSSHLVQTIFGLQVPWQQAGQPGATCLCPGWSFLHQLTDWESEPIPGHIRQAFSFPWLKLLTSTYRFRIRTNPWSYQASFLFCFLFCFLFSLAEAAHINLQTENQNQSHYLVISCFLFVFSLFSGHIRQAFTLLSFCYDWRLRIRSIPGQSKLFLWCPTS